MKCRNANTLNCRTATNGSIKYLKNKKRNRYAVHPPTTEFTLSGVPKTPKAICYVDDWFSAFEILTAYKAGTYEAGMECKLNLAPNKIKVNTGKYRLMKKTA